MLIGVNIGGTMHSSLPEPVLIINQEDRQYVENLIKSQCMVQMDGKTFRRTDNDTWKRTEIRSAYNFNNEVEEECSNEQFITQATSLFVRGGYIHITKPTLHGMLIKNISVFKATKMLINDVLNTPTRDWYGTIERIDKQIELLTSIRDSGLHLRYGWGQRCKVLMKPLRMLKTLLETQSQDPDIYIKLIVSHEAGKLAKMSGGVIDLEKRRHSL